MSARRHSSSRLRVREWAIVTVQSSRSSSCATGLPTMLERPITTARSAREVPELALEQRDAAHGRARNEAVLARDERSHVDRVEAVDVLPRIEQLQHRFRVDMPRQGKLDQDPVHRLVRVESAQERRELLLGRARGKPVDERVHSRLPRLLALVAHVDLARGILADEHDREPGRHRVLALQRPHRLAHLRAQLCRDFLAVDDLRGSPSPRTLPCSWPLSGTMAPPSPPARRRPHHSAPAGSVNEGCGMAAMRPAHAERIGGCASVRRCWRRAPRPMRRRRRRPPATQG